MSCKKQEKSTAVSINCRHTPSTIGCKGRPPKMVIFNGRKVLCASLVMGRTTFQIGRILWIYMLFPSDIKSKEDVCKYSFIEIEATHVWVCRPDFWKWSQTRPVARLHSWQATAGTSPVQWSSVQFRTPSSLSIDKPGRHSRDRVTDCTEWCCFWFTMVQGTSWCSWARLALLHWCGVSLSPPCLAWAQILYGLMHPARGARPPHTLISQQSRQESSTTRQT